MKVLADALFWTPAAERFRLRPERLWRAAGMSASVGGCYVAVSSGVPTLCRAPRSTIMCSRLGHATRQGELLWTRIDQDRPPDRRSGLCAFSKKNLRRMPSNTINSNKSWKELRRERIRSNGLVEQEACCRQVALTMVQKNRRRGSCRWTVD
jgi:hypothetical protein